MPESIPRTVLLMKVIDQMFPNDVEFYLSPELEPTVKIASDTPRKEWPADGPRFKDYVNKKLWEKYQELVATGEADGFPAFLGPSDREFVMSLIREKCRSGGVRLTDFEKTTSENDPIVQGVILYMNSHPVYHDRTAELLQVFRRYQDDGLISQTKKLPELVNFFSRKLKQHAVTLRSFGVAVEVKHRESGSYCRLDRLPSFEAEPTAQLVENTPADDWSHSSSGGSSGLTINSDTRLRRPDGDDGRIRFDPPDAKRTLYGSQRSSAFNEKDDHSSSSSSLPSDALKADRNGGAA